jgi:hypothetical protein
LRSPSPQALIIAGICGALDPSLAPGTLVVSRGIVTDGAPELLADPPMLEAARAALRSHAGAQYVSARLVTVASPMTDPAQRRDAWNTFGAAAVDMETYALAEAARDHGVAWLAIRAVSDDAHARLPGSIAGWRSEDDDTRVARRIAMRPWEWLSALRLFWGTRAALRSLGRATPAIIHAIERIDSTAQPDASRFRVVS